MDQRRPQLAMDVLVLLSLAFQDVLVVDGEF
jgi:hypothetical protein